MKIALAQLDCKLGDIATNTSRMADFARQAADRGCELVVFPEMSDTGYVPERFSEWAEPWPGASFDALAAAAAESSIAIVAGLCERAGGKVYNSLAFFSPEGELIASYRKIHLFSASPGSETEACTPGDEVQVCDFAGIRWGLSICYDLRFPELYRKLSAAGATVLIDVAAWPATRPTHWDYLTRARAIENQAFLIAATRAGQDESITMLGHSRVVAPMGDLIVEAGDQEELLIADLDFALVDTFRKTIPAIEDRRVDLFG
jgi:predicted amidohydrolase